MFEEWSDDGRPVLPVDLNRPGALEVLRDFYGLPTENVLREVLSQAYRAGAQTAVLERRYIDADYRNEHSTFYSKTFRRYPSVAHRLHFFSDSFTHPAGAARPFIFRDRGYLGYSVLRPVPAAPVGRTMLRAPDPASSQTVMCLARDRVNVFGTDLEVVGAPFYAQDAQLSRCGQVSMLMAAYYHHRVFRRQRFLPEDISAAVEGSAGELGRHVPSPGLNMAQFADAASAIGLPALTYPMERLLARADAEATVCRYLNSRLPVVVVTASHAFLLIGYERRMNADGEHEVRFLRHDDEVGPYQWVERWRLDDRYGPWQHLVVPMPSKVYLHGQVAEDIGIAKVRDVLEHSSDPEDRALLEQLNDKVNKPLSWRSAVLPSNEFKRAVTRRGLPDAVASTYQFAYLSRYVWIVELTDRTLRDGNKPCVLAEAVIDATDHERDPKPLAWRIPSGLGVNLPDMGRAIFGPGLRSPYPTESVVTTYAPHDHEI